MAEEGDTDHDDTEHDENEPLLSDRSSPCIEHVQSRVAAPEKGVMLVRTRRTLASVIFGERTRVNRWFRRFMSNSTVIYVLFVLWYTGASLGLLALTPFVPRACVWASVLMLPLPLLAFLVLSKDLVGQCLVELEFYIMMALQTVLLICAVALLRDRRCVFWGCLAPMMGIACLVDAYPARYRAIFAKCYFTGLTVVFVIWNLMLILNWCAWTPRFYRVGHIEGSIAACSFTTQSTVLVYFLRHLGCAFLHQDRFVLIRSHMITRIEELSATVDEEGAVTEIHSTPRHVEVKRSKSLKSLERHGTATMDTPQR